MSGFKAMQQEMREMLDKANNIVAKNPTLTNDYLIKEGYIYKNNLFFEKPDESTALIVVIDDCAYKVYDKNKFDYNDPIMWNNLPMISTIDELNAIKAARQ